MSRQLELYGERFQFKLPRFLRSRWVQMRNWVTLPVEESEEEL